MKKLLLALSLLGSIAASAQSEKLITPDLSKAKAIIHPHNSGVIVCGGSSNNQSVDLDWMPILSRKKPLEKEHESMPGVEEAKEAKNAKKFGHPVPSVYSANKTTAYTPVVGTNFAGYAPMPGTPLDNSMAISNGGIIVNVENSQLSYYNSTGTLLYHNTFLSLLPFSGIVDVCDPVVLYDAGKDRFIFYVQEVGSMGIFPNNRIFFGFSKSNNPSVDGWWTYQFTADATGAGDYFDYPKMAINDSELYISGNLFDPSSSAFDQSIMLQMDKLAGYAGNPVTYVSWSSLPGPAFTILPVSAGQGTNITTGMVAVSTFPSGATDINLYAITGNVCCSPTMAYYDVPTTGYSVPGDAGQLGTSTTLMTGDCRAMSGFYLNGVVHFAFHGDVGTGYTGIFYNRLVLSTLTNTTSTFSLPGLDCAYPAVASFATSATDKSVMIGFASSGSSAYPAIRAVSCDDAMTWSPSTIVKSGSYTDFGSPTNRWGDYSGISRKHNSTTPSVWISGGYGRSGHDWATWISEIHGIAPACTVPVGLSVDSITAHTVVLNWTAVSGAISYNIQYRKVGTTAWSTATATTNSKKITGLVINTNYEFQVQAVCSSTSTSAFSASTTFITHSGVGVSAVAADDQVKVYPNPVWDVFTVEFPLTESTPLNISVVDMSGRLVKELYNNVGTSGQNVFSFNKANLAVGNYMLIIRTNEKVIRNEKIVVAR